jgi:hypothetical protein
MTRKFADLSFFRAKFAEMTMSIWSLSAQIEKTNPVGDRWQGQSRVLVDLKHNKWVFDYFAILWNRRDNEWETTKFKLCTLWQDKTIKLQTTFMLRALGSINENSKSKTIFCLHGWPIWAMIKTRRQVTGFLECHH